jgi:hypothetical protein
MTEYAAKPLDPALAQRDEEITAAAHAAFEAQLEYARELAAAARDAGREAVTRPVALGTAGEQAVAWELRLAALAFELALGLALTVGVVGGAIASFDVELGEAGGVCLVAVALMVTVGLVMLVPTLGFQSARLVRGRNRVRLRLGVLRWADPRRGLRAGRQRRLVHHAASLEFSQSARAGSVHVGARAPKSALDWDEDIWLELESRSLAEEARRLSASLDAKLDYVRTRCDAIINGA